MMSESRDIRKAIDAVYALMEYVGGRCSQQYDVEMEERFHDVLTAVEGLAPGQPPPAHPDQWLNDRYLIHNYLVAQISSLLVFVNDVSAVAERDAIEQLREPLARLRTAFAGCHKKFICEDPDAS